MELKFDCPKGFKVVSLPSGRYQLRPDREPNVYMPGIDKYPNPYYLTFDVSNMEWAVHVDEKFAVEFYGIQANSCKQVAMDKPVDGGNDQKIGVIPEGFGLYIIEGAENIPEELQGKILCLPKEKWWFRGSSVIPVICAPEGYTPVYVASTTTILFVKDENLKVLVE